MIHPLDDGSALDGALWYAERWGALVAPADPDKKKPLIKTGKHHAEHSSRDPDVIRGWRTQWDVPGVRAAVVTGPASGVLVIDLDQHEPGKDGLESLVALESQHGVLPAETPRARTGHGLHVVMRYPTGVDIRNSVSAVAPGVDVRGVGGIFIAPPAPDRAWLCEAHPEETPLAEVPPAWVALLAGARARRSTDRRRLDLVESTTDDDVPLDVTFRLPTTISEGERNDTLFRYACSMRAREVKWTLLAAAVARANRDRCTPTLSDDEVDAILTSVEAYPAGRRAA